LLNASRSAPLTNCSVIDAWPSVPVYGLLRTLTLCAWCWSRIAPCSTPESRTGHRLLCVRHLTLGSAQGYLPAPHSAPCVDRGCLRGQHLELRIESVDLRLRHLSLRPEQELLPVRHLALRSACGSLRSLHLAPRVGRCFSVTMPPARNGLSLACNGCLSPDHHSRVKVPGLLLRLLALGFPGPFGSSAPLPGSVCPNPGRFSASKPVAASTSGSPTGYPSFHSPLRNSEPPET